ncbi:MULTISPECIES: hypothetical protein [Bacillus]|uniref:hypothetical protein n=1 Tax=Bacillus TaxID=1386 RepID=UPI0017AEB578|nr:MULTISPECIES: hypothetical protein [Bacillus]MDI3409729.1 hypothetical protein [Bacillus sonorensis]MEC0340045.1 hypothetical protein [Bacillus sonorensis]MEC0425722.1 hypothetical protein [Bacillus sonorensis]MEC0458581.1 hypothetical protein [Bacillus sonorensis]MEC0528158.1 hypothetical protein [Bacillus sonorensis]
MTVGKIEITEDKVLKLKPIFESIVSRKYGKDIRFRTLTMGGITVKDHSVKKVGR